MADDIGVVGVCSARALVLVWSGRWGRGSGLHRDLVGEMGSHAWSSQEEQSSEPGRGAEVVGDSHSAIVLLSGG
ncbi:hypothetical protein CDL15_Pgr027093 [Punica granatum]|nr:hypothetical protein CDL15_Pgr027093 [Punica granatum]